MTEQSERQERIAKLERERTRIDGTWAVGHEYVQQKERLCQIDAELSRLRNEQPKGGDAALPNFGKENNLTQGPGSECDRSGAKPVAWKFRWKGRTDWLYTDVRVQVDAMLNDSFYEVKPLIDMPLNSPAPSPGAQDVRERAYKTWFDGANAYAKQHPDVLNTVEEWPEEFEEHEAGIIKAGVDALLAAIAQSDAQPVGCPVCKGGGEVIDEKTNRIVGCDACGQSGKLADFWVIERRGAGAPEYFYFPHSLSARHGWTSGIESACQFIRRQDARSCISALGLGNEAYAVEHGWVTVPPRPDASAGLVDAAKWHDDQEGICKDIEKTAPSEMAQGYWEQKATFHRDSARDLRTLAADRTAPETETKTLSEQAKYDLAVARQTLDRVIIPSAANPDKPSSGNQP